MQYCGFFTLFCTVLWFSDRPPPPCLPHAPLLKQEVHAVYVPLSMKLVQCLTYCLTLVLVLK